MYRTIDAAFWTDPKVKGLSAKCKLLFLYLVTNPHTHISGIYYLDPKYAALDLGYPIDTLLDTLSSLEICSFDRQTNVVWVRTMFKYQGHGEKNLRSAAYHLTEDLHNSRLIDAFLEAYPTVKPFVKNRVSIPYPSLALLTPNPNPNPNPNRGHAAEPVKFVVCGEFGNVRLTKLELDKLEAKLNGNYQEYIDRLDRWGAEEPAKFRKKQSHYATILNWAARDKKGGPDEPGKRTPKDNPGSTPGRTSKGDPTYTPRQ